MNELISGSQLIFEGRVLSVESRFTPDMSQIRTYMNFQIIEVVKGSYPASTIELSFLGGSVGDLTLSVSDMHVPELGEWGIYFVESLTRRQIHPLYGWDQGHFLITAGTGGTTTVLTRDRRKVIAVSSAQTESVELSRGVALGVKASHQPKASGLSTAVFKKILRELAGSRR